MNFIWFVHVPRTGGTSIINSRHMFKLTTILTGSPHMPYTTQQHMQFKEKFGEVKTLTVLRDPVQHSMSYYSYIVAHPSHFGHRLAINNSFSDWLKKCKELPNYFVKFFSTWDNPSAGNLPEALEKISKFDYILDTANLTAQFNHVLAENNEPHRFSLHINGNKKFEISKDDVAYIKQIRSQDYKFIKGLI